MDSEVTGSLVFSGAMIRHPVTVAITIDGIFEDVEDFFCVLSTNDSAVILDPQRAIISILDGMLL